jgi:TRAP-type mannitol/chloroaromatic compound transport system substrate-binding protein
MKTISKKIIALGILTMFALAGCGGGGSDSVSSTSDAGTQTQEKVVLKMASAFPATLQLIGTNGIKLSDTIKQVSNGTLELKFFEPGALVP